jgi:release factor glutamine methyltransferase
MSQDPFGARLLSEITCRLQAAGIGEARLEAQLLAAHALGVSRAAVLAGSYGEPGAGRLAEIERWVSERERRVPFAYLRGDQEFYGLSFEVGPGVLVPRPETELLVDFALERLRDLGPDRTPLIVDVGTGSGCIAIATLASFPAARAVATDLSPIAARFARRNAVRLGVKDRLRIVRCDLASAVRTGSADLVLSNPPYIPDDDIAGLQPEVRDFEPRLALAGGGDGLDTIRRLLIDAFRILREGGWLAVETGIGQAKAVATLMEEHCDVEIRPDLANIERVVCAKQTGSDLPAHE